MRFHAVAIFNTEHALRSARQEEHGRHGGLLHKEQSICAANNRVFKCWRGLFSTGAVFEKNTATGKGDDDRLALFDIPFDEFLNRDLIVGEDHFSIRDTRVELFREPANYYGYAVFG